MERMLFNIKKNIEADSREMGEDITKDITKLGDRTGR